MNEIDIITKLGMTKNEAKVYLTLLKIGKSNVASIAKSSKIYRPYVYDNLKKLQERGIVAESSIENKKIFSAIGPEKLIEIEEEKIDSLRKILPSLNELITTKKENTEVKLYSGEKVIRIIQKDIISTLKKSGGESLVIGVDEKKFMKTDEIAMLQFFEQMKLNNLKEKILVREGDNFLPGHEKTTSYKFLPKEFFEPTSTFVYGNKVAIVIFSQPLYCLIIESKEISETYRKQFNLLWKLAKS